MNKSFELDRRALLAIMAAASVTGGMASAQENAPSNTDNLVEEFELGNPDASVTVIEYASFTCPHCANFHADVWPRLKANYVDTGKIRFIYRPVYFDGPGLWADLVARCGGQERFFGITDLLYKRQAEWSRAPSQAEVGSVLQAIGRQAGLDDDTILACMQDSENAQALVAAFQENTTRDNIDSTPSFLINGELTPNMSYESFVEILDAKLAE